MVTMPAPTALTSRATMTRASPLPGSSCKKQTPRLNSRQGFSAKRCMTLTKSASTRQNDVPPAVPGTAASALHPLLRAQLVGFAVMTTMHLAATPANAVTADSSYPSFPKSHPAVFHPVSAAQLHLYQASSSQVVPGSASVLPAVTAASVASDPSNWVLVGQPCFNCQPGGPNQCRCPDCCVVQGPHKGKCRRLDGSMGGCSNPANMKENPDGSISCTSESEAAA